LVVVVVGGVALSRIFTVTDSRFISRIMKDYFICVLLHSKIYHSLNYFRKVIHQYLNIRGLKYNMFPSKCKSLDDKN